MNFQLRISHDVKLLELLYWQITQIMVIIPVALEEVLESQERATFIVKDIFSPDSETIFVIQDRASFVEDLSAGS